MSQMYKLPINLNIVQSQSGAKGDFLAGWLGTLPMFLENHWTLDCETGISFTHAKFFKDYHSSQNLDDFLAERNFFLSDNPIFQVAGTTHHITFPTFTTHHLKHTKIISIQVSDDDLLEVQWNHFVKNCLTHHRYEWAVWNNTRIGVDHFINKPQLTDHERRSWIHNNMHQYFPEHPKPVCSIANWVFNYKDVFTPSGSKLIAAALNLQCSEQHHDLWRKNLDFSNAPMTIKRFGQEYTFEEFKHMYQKQFQ